MTRRLRLILQCVPLRLLATVLCLLQATATIVLTCCTHTPPLGASLHMNRLTGRARPDTSEKLAEARKLAESTRSIPKELKAYFDLQIDLHPPSS